MKRITVPSVLSQDNESQSKSDRPFVGYESAPQVSGNQGYMIFKTLHCKYPCIHSLIHHVFMIEHVLCPSNWLSDTNKIRTSPLVLKENTILEENRCVTIGNRVRKFLFEVFIFLFGGHSWGWQAERQQFKQGLGGSKLKLQHGMWIRLLLLQYLNSLSDS